MLKVKTLIINIASLLKVLFTKEKMVWSHLSSSILDSQIDSQVKVWDRCILSHVGIGRGTYIGPNSMISWTTIGKFCSIGPNLLCGWGIHPITGLSTSPSFYSKTSPTGVSYSQEDKFIERRRVFIGNDVFIGANVTILDGVRIGDGCVIGAGAVVSKDIEPYAIAVGCPIKIIKYRFSEQTIQSLLKIKWWDREEDFMDCVEKDFFNVQSFVSKNDIKD